MRIAALQYCAGATADVTFPVIDALIAKAVEKEATMVCLPEAASFLPAEVSVGHLTGRLCCTLVGPHPAKARRRSESPEV